MNIFGPCSFISLDQKDQIIETAKQIKELKAIFRCKVWLGGTKPEKYIYPEDPERLEILKSLDVETMTEVHTPEQIKLCEGLYGIWIGARNSANYSLLKEAANFKGKVYIKRNPAMTLDEIIGIYDIMKEINHKEIAIIERGTVHFDRSETSRWKININDVLCLKYDRPDIFKSLIIDCSHSMGRSDFVIDCYRAFKAVGCENFMIECTSDGKSKTDTNQIISVDKIKKEIYNYIWG